MRIDKKRAALLAKLNAGDKITLMANKKEGWDRVVVKVVEVEHPAYPGMIMVESDDVFGDVFEVHVSNVEVK